MNFTEIVNSTIAEIANLANIEQRICPDQCLGQISYITRNKAFERTPAADRPSEEKALIVILESPHKEEFINNPCPANGKTGKLLVEHLLQVKGLSSYKDHFLIVINAIQYQCSLGYPTRNFRDIIFNWAWNNGGREDFEERLKNVLKPKDTVVNCCTKGNSKDLALRKMVHTTLKDLLPQETQLLRRTHPSSWHSSKNRKFEWSFDS